VSRGARAPAPAAPVARGAARAQSATRPRRRPRRAPRRPASRNAPPPTHRHFPLLVPAPETRRAQTLNYAPVAVGIVLAISFLFWILPGIGACHWFTGPPHVPDAHVTFDASEAIVDPEAAKAGVPRPKPVIGDDSARGAQ
jgi:hypothetical protein